MIEQNDVFKYLEQGLQRDLQYEIDTNERKAQAVIKIFMIILDIVYPSTWLLKSCPKALKEKQYLGKKIRDCINNMWRMLDENNEG
jgi:hypothetical protein